MSTNIQESFLKLVRCGIGVSKDTIISNDVDWAQLKALAGEQGLTALVLDGLDAVQGAGLMVHHPVPFKMKLEWIGEVLQDYEQQYEQYKKAIGSLAAFYNKHGFKMMVLKGYACALDWPKPEHRPCGDIDIWQFGKQKEADEALSNTNRPDCTNKIKIDRSHHHHTVFEWQGFTVENHYDFISVYHHRSHIKLEKVFKELGKDDSHYVELYGEKIYLPSPNLHALFLLKHAVLHFCSTELTIRQILDWAFFVEKHGKDVDWEWLKKVLDEHGMMPFFNIVNAICMEDLGFDISIFPSVQFIPSQKDRVLHEIFSYVYEEDTTSNIIMRQIYRFQRWKGNAWKHELCYKESMWSAFWSGVWGHLLKPSTL